MYFKSKSLFQIHKKNVTSKPTLQENVKGHLSNRKKEKKIPILIYLHEGMKSIRNDSMCVNIKYFKNKFNSL